MNDIAAHILFVLFAFAPMAVGLMLYALFGIVLLLVRAARHLRSLE